MSKLQFWAKLRELRDQGWEIVEGCIRCKRGDCPITAVANVVLKGDHFSVGAFDVAGEALGLENQFVTDLSQAADYDYDPDDITAAARLRKRLLKELNLKEAA
jgi:hypothetical protein